MTAALTERPEDSSYVLRLQSHASAAAEHDNRQATITDLWYQLARTSAATLVDNAHGLLFILVHGTPEPPVAHADPEVHVVIRNDDYTPARFVSYVVHAIFDKPPEDAVATMRTAHEQGRAIVGRYPTPKAIELVTAARAKAKESASRCGSSSSHGEPSGHHGRLAPHGEGARLTLAGRPPGLTMIG